MTPGRSLDWQGILNADERGGSQVARTNRDDAPAVDLHPWPFAVNNRALRIVKTVLGAGMIFLLLTQVLPGNLLGGVMNNFFTLLLLLSWAGPARRMMRRYSSGGGKNRSAEDPKTDEA